VGEKPVNSVGTAEYDNLLTILRDARKRAGFTQRGLSLKLGKSPTYLDKIERGVRRIDVVELCQIALAMGIDPRDLFTTFVDAAFPRSDGG